MGGYGGGGGGEGGWGGLDLRWVASWACGTLLLFCERRVKRPPRNHSRVAGRCKREVDSKA